MFIRKLHSSVKYKNGVTMYDYGTLLAPEDEFCPHPWPHFLISETCPGFAGDFVWLATDNSEADPAAVFTTFIVRCCAEMFGFAPEKGPRIYVGETMHPPRLFAVICGNSSKARKGTSVHPVTRLFDQKDLPANDRPLNLLPPARASTGPLSTGEGLAFHVRDETDEEREQWQRQNPNEPLREKGDKRLIIIDEEFSSALTCTKRVGNTLSMALRSFWDTGDYSPLTKSMPLVARGAHVNIVSHITTQELAACLDAVQAMNGFGNRFLWICARRSKLVPLPERIADTKLAPIRRELWRVISLAQQRGVITLTKGAQELWEYIYPELSEEHSGITGSLVSRGEAQTIRLSLIYALLDGKDQIEETHLESARAMWSYSRDSTLYIFSHWTNKNSLDQKIMKALEKGALTASELSAALGRNTPKSQMEPALKRLEAQNRIEISMQQTGPHRPTIIIAPTRLF